MLPKALNYVPTNNRVILSLVLLLGMSLTSVFGIISYSILSVNKETHITVENYVAAIIKEKLNHQKTLTKDYAYWDDTIKNAYLSQDSEWIEGNIGKYLTDTFKITDLFIINNNDDAILSLKDGQVDKSNFLTINKAALKALIVKARQSGPIPIPASGILMINDVPALVGVSILAPEDGTSLPSPRPLLFLAIRLDSSYLQSMSKQYRLTGLHFIFGKQDSSNESSIKVINPLNKILGRLSWQSENPGNLVLTKIQLPLLLLLIVTALITAFIINASRNTARRLDKALAEIKTLQGIIPICSYCHNIRDDEGAWERMESYISKHSGAKFSHGICPKCLESVSKDTGLVKQKNKDISDYD